MLQSQFRISDRSKVIVKKFLLLNQFWPTPLQRMVLLNHQHLPLILIFLLPFEKASDLALIILFQILFPKIIFTLFFVSLLYLCLLSLYPSLVKRFIGTCLEAGHVWGDGCSGFSRNLGVLVSTPGAVVVGCRWVYTITYRPDGSVDRYKVRFMAKCYTRTYGVDYFKTFSPVAWMNSIKILFCVNVNLSLPLFHLNVKNAFLYGDLHEKVYIKQPTAYAAREKNTVCYLKKAIYGQGHGLRSSALPSLALIFTDVTPITLWFHSARKVWRRSSNSVCWWHFANWQWFSWAIGLSAILWPKTWGDLNTFWGLKLHIKNIVYFFRNESLF